MPLRRSPTIQDEESKMAQPNLDIAAELSRFNPVRFEGTPNAYVYSGSTPRNQFFTVISEILGTPNFVIMVARDFFDPAFALEVINFVLERKEEITLPLDHCILHGFAPSNFKFSSMLFLGPNVNGVLHGRSENLQPRSIQAIPIYRCEFSEIDTLETIDVARRYQVITIDWEREPCPRAWIRFKNSKTETIGKRMWIDKEERAITETHRLSDGAGGWMELRNYKEEQIKITFENGSFLIQLADGQSIALPESELNAWIHSFCVRIESV